MCKELGYHSGQLLVGQKSTQYDVILANQKGRNACDNSEQELKMCENLVFGFETTEAQACSSSHDVAVRCYPEQFAFHDTCDLRQP